MERKSRVLSILWLIVAVLILAVLILDLVQGGVWILEGLNGKDAYEIAVENGFSGTRSEWLASLAGTDGTNGTNGKSAYEQAVENGFCGSVEEWLLSLSLGEKGKDGLDGVNGKDGKNGTDGRDGKNGVNGADGVGIASVYIDGEGHLIVLLTNGSRCDAGVVSGIDPDGGKNDYRREVREETYSGTYFEWLCSFADGSRTGISLTGVQTDADGHLILSLSDGTTRDGGYVGADGFSGSVDADGFRQVLEFVDLSEETALNLHVTKDIDEASRSGTAKKGVPILRIGISENDGGEWSRFLYNGTVRYARSHYFAPVET